MSVDLHPGLLRSTAPQQQSESQQESPEKAAQLREAAVKFEELMLRQLFTQMQRSTSVDGKKPMATEFYGDMFAEKMAENASSQGGIGIAEVLMRAWGVDETGAQEASGQLDWGTEQIDEFARYTSPLQGAEFTTRAEGRQLEFQARDAEVVAPRAGRVLVADGDPRIEHPGGWVTRFEGLAVRDGLDGQWVDRGTSIGRAPAITATIESPLT